MLTFSDIRLSRRTLSQLGHGVGPARQKFLETTIHASLRPFSLDLCHCALGLALHLVFEVMGPDTCFAYVVTYVKAQRVRALSPDAVQLVLAVVVVRAINLGDLVQLHSLASADTPAITISA